MAHERLTMTEVAKIAQQQRTLRLKQQDSALLTQFGSADDDDSHLDLTTRIRFLEACGGPPPFVLERIDESGNMDRYLFERPFLIAGRSAACDVACRMRTLSFRHLYLQYLNGVVWWFDLDSRSGVIQDGKKRRAGCLRPGMSIQAGGFTFRLVDATRTEGQAPEPATPESSPNTLIVGQQPGLPQVTLEFENGKVRGEENTVLPVENSVMLLGRRSCCDIRFADDGVSRVHASLVLTQEGLWVVDLLGRGGTRVNGVSSAYAYLHDGSLLEMGSYRIRVRYANSAPHPAEAVLDQAERPSPGNAQKGMVSEEMLCELVTNMAAMQKQMFDQSQMQIGLLVQMLGSIHQSQQDMLREELSRVNDISKEMHDLQLQLTSQKGSSPVDSPKRLAAEPDRAREPVQPSPPASGSEAEAGSEDYLPAPSLFPDEEPSAVSPAESSPRANANEIQDHAVLFQRMQNLDRERNGRLQKIFRAFRGSS